MIQLPTTVQLKREHTGKRIERVLSKLLPGIKESFLLMLIHRGKVLFEGRAVRRGERLPRPGRVEILAPDPRTGPRRPVANPKVVFTVRHEDPDVVVVEKPAGLAMHPGPQHGTDTLQNGLVARFPELADLGIARGFGLVQRLDRDVSGLVVVARSVRAHEALVAAFTKHEVDKRYRALGLGSPPAREGTVETPVDGSPARSRWELLEEASCEGTLVSLLALRSFTGRKHQLRIHMAGVGCPLLGDRQHGPATLPIARRLGLRRIALHADLLAFRHPVSGEHLSFTAPWPADLESAWTQVVR